MLQMRLLSSALSIGSTRGRQRGQQVDAPAQLQKRYFAPLPSLKLMPARSCSAVPLDLLSGMSSSTGVPSRLPFAWKSPNETVCIIPFTSSDTDGDSAIITPAPPPNTNPVVDRSREPVENPSSEAWAVWVPLAQPPRTPTKGVSLLPLVLRNR